jgi:hypothetical protein
MQYRLAKQLEAAGWPQVGTGRWISDPASLVARGRIYAPTLEELIEACGAAPVSLSREENGRWTAYGSAGLTVVGSDPVEVAARLWLQMRR